jgi:uncharacterized protein DUF2782
MRRLVLLLAFLSCNAVAQRKPPALEPLPEPPPPPEPGVEQPEVQIERPAQGDKVEEIREGGRVVMLKVTPKGGGKPYYLVDTTGQGNWTRRDSLDNGVRVPMWPLLIFD